MDPLESALIILVVLWSLVFLIMGISLVIVMRRVTEALDKINRILQTAENVGEGVSVPLRAAASSLIGLIHKDKPSEKRRPR